MNSLYYMHVKDELVYPQQDGLKHTLNFGLIY